MCGGIKRGSISWTSSPGLRVISEDIEKGVDAGFELPGSKNVREMGNVALPPVRQKTGVIRQQLHNRATAGSAPIRGFSRGRWWLLQLVSAACWLSSETHGSAHWAHKHQPGSACCSSGHTHVALLQYYQAGNPGRSTSWYHFLFPTLLSVFFFF